MRETLYEMPGLAGEPLKVSETSVYGSGEVTYISDDVSADAAFPWFTQTDRAVQIGLHKIENASEDELAVSLHLYTPPYAEKSNGQKRGLNWSRTNRFLLDGCYCFDEKTGKKTKVEMCNYYSVHGKLKAKG